MRRYFVVNGFDGALTMLGLITGFKLGAEVDIGVVVGACVGATIALGVSGVSSAYLSESAERRRMLSELEHAMVSDLSSSAHASAARVVPLFIALANGAAPVFISLLIITPLWLSRAGVGLPLAPLTAAIATAFVCIFSLGAFLGRVGGTSWVRSGIKTVFIALADYRHHPFPRRRSMSWTDAPAVPWHCLSPDDVIARLECDAERGLTPAEAEARLREVGENAIAEGRRRSLAAMFLRQFSDFMILVLLAAAAISGIIGEPLGHRCHRGDRCPQRGHRDGAGVSR